jgi:hypothetical protein
LSRPGRPRVSFAVDKSTHKDAKFISGIENLGQALQLRVWTARGTIPADPAYGQRRLIGLNVSGGNLDLLGLTYRENISGDPRVLLVKNVNVQVPEGKPDQVDVEFDVIPVGGTELQTFRSVVI